MLTPYQVRSDRFSMLGRFHNNEVGNKQLNICKPKCTSGKIIKIPGLKYSLLNIHTNNNALLASVQAVAKAALTISLELLVII